MSINIDVKLYTKEKLTPGFIKSVFNCVQSIGGKYYMEVEKISIEEKIKKISRRIKKPSRSEGSWFRILFKNGRWPIFVCFEGNRDGYNIVWISISESYLQPNHENEHIFYNLIRRLIKKTKPVFGVGDNDMALGNLGDMENVGKYIRSVKIPYISSLLLLGPAYLKKYGEEKLLKTPSLIAEKIGDGVFIVVDYCWFANIPRCWLALANVPRGNVKKGKCSAKAIKYLEDVLKEGNVEHCD